LKQLNYNLTLPTALNNQDIHICHPLKSKRGKNSIIIKFARRSVRNKVYSLKSNLKSAERNGNTKLSITEALTKRRLQLVAAANQAFGLKNVWNQWEGLL